MRGYAFTLIEMMIAILLFSMVTLFLTSTLEHQRKNYTILKEATASEDRLQKMQKLLQDDIIQSQELLIIKGDTYISLELRTTSSLYGIAAPYVKWFVNPKTQELIRSESAINLLPPFNSDELTRVHLDLVHSGVKWFQAYSSKDSTSLFVAIQIDSKSIFLEILTPQHKKELSK